MASEPSPEDLARLRVDHDTKREFLIEHNILRVDEQASREAIREAIKSLPEHKQRNLEQRLTERKEHLEDIMDGSKKEFEAAKVDAEDLVKDTDDWAWSDTTN